VSLKGACGRVVESAVVGLAKGKGEYAQAGAGNTGMSKRIRKDVRREREEGRVKWMWKWMWMWCALLCCCRFYMSRLMEREPCNNTHPPQSKLFTPVGQTLVQLHQSSHLMHAMS
jgi:hypothetical protein